MCFRVRVSVPWQIIFWEMVYLRTVIMRPDYAHKHFSDGRDRYELLIISLTRFGC